MSDAPPAYNDIAKPPYPVNPSYAPVAPTQAPYPPTQGPYPTTQGPYPQAPYPTNTGYQPTPYPPQHYPQQPTNVTVVQAPPQQVIVSGGNCPACHTGTLSKELTCCGVCCAIVFFPIGIICCIAMMESRCTSCHARF